MRDENQPARAKPLRGLLSLLLALLVLGLIVWRAHFLIDDAYISFRYAVNWADGHGPVYNPGTAAPVEGYSNFLWVVLLAIGAALGASPVLLAPVLTFLAAAGTLVLVQRFLVQRLHQDDWSSALALLALATFPCFAVWASGGMETALFGLLLFACWSVLVTPPAQAEVRRGLTAGLLGIALLLTRVEGGLWIGGLCAAAIVAQRPRIPWRRLVVFLAVIACGMIPHLLWRHATYGEWVANTVHAKSGFSLLTLARGARSLATFALAFLWPVLVLTVPFFVRDAARRRLGLSALLVLGGFLAYNLAVGGDWMPMFRFLAPASPFLVVLLALGLERLPLAARLGGGCLAIAVALLPLYDVSITPRAWREALYFRGFRVGYQTEWDRWRTTVTNTERNVWRGKALAQVLEGGESWTGGAIGATGYYSGVRVLDRHGLVNREVARREVESGGGTAGHEKRVSPTYFRAQKPTFYRIFVSPTPVPPRGKAFDAAIRRVMPFLFAEPGDYELTQCSVAEVIEVPRIPPLPEGACLLVVKHVDDAKRARAFWSRFL